MLQVFIRTCILSPNAGQCIPKERNLVSNQFNCNISGIKTKVICYFSDILLLLNNKYFLIKFTIFTGSTSQNNKSLIDNIYTSISFLPFYRSIAITERIPDTENEIFLYEIHHESNNNVDSYIQTNLPQSDSSFLSLVLDINLILS